ncbi:hypothetical protein HYC85_024893 [Camellia sinensis]|uniref:PUB domain-containing protein n=1 Tax=Camellia sinensis TaxID=4442 RepID=A0A7J7G9Y3_CAMSI|nr:hypothetical protein HYC85_024893 [Camellia sinensis]
MTLGLYIKRGEKPKRCSHLNSAHAEQLAAQPNGVKPRGTGNAAVSTAVRPLMRLRRRWPTKWDSSATVFFFLKWTDFIVGGSIRHTTAGQLTVSVLPGRRRQEKLGVQEERIRVGKELLDAKRIEEENERKWWGLFITFVSSVFGATRVVASWKAEKEEEKRAREKIRQKLEEDKRYISQAERRRKLGLPPEDPVAAKPSAPAVEEKNSLVPVRPATKAEQMRECLRSLKQNHKDNEAKVKMAFNTLLTYARNVATNTNEEKFRKIRLSNAAFQARVGALKGGIKFLELCGFKKIDSGEFLSLPRDKVDMAVLNSAGTELNSAINNPFFGVL